MTRPILLITIVAISMTKNPLEGQNSRPLLCGVGEGKGVKLGRGVDEPVGRGLGVLMLLVFVAAGTSASVPVTDNRLSRTRDSAEVVSSPKKRKFCVS